ncbi:MAG TPA: prepilin peptidase [Pirellulaceae bacterium]|jgi:leader peptidase (prepilin peptidase)/N-methyltransferase
MDFAAETGIHDPLLPLWAMEALAQGFLWAWLFCLGATVGSFLNVVVYRLPRGKNLAYPGSYCPRCGHPIRLSDNIPILSWLVLRGKCRDCGGRISSRYFFVELTVATLFLVVLASEQVMPVGLGFTLDYVPRTRIAPHDGPPFWCLYAMHVVLITTLVGAILIAADGFAVPSSMFLPVILLGFVVPLIWPQTRMLPAADGPMAGWPAGLIDGVAGLAAGVLSGLWIRLIRGRETNPWSTQALIALGCAVGVVLGWQPTPLWTGLIWIFGLIAGRLLSRPQPRDEPPQAIDSEANAETAPVMQPEAPMPPAEILPVPPTQEIDPP